MKKELYLPIIIIALTIIFGVICLMVYLSDGNAYWIKKKLKIGALLLTFNGIVYGTSAQSEVSCYLVVPKKVNSSMIGILFNASSVNQLSPTINSNEITENLQLFDATSTGYTVGFSYEFVFGDFYESLSSIICNLKYDYKPGKIEENLSMLPYLDPEKGVMFKYSRIEIEYSFSFITTEVLYKQKFIHEIPVGIIIGPYFSIPIKLNAHETLYTGDTEQDSIGISYDEKKIIYDNEIKDAKPIDIGMVAGIQYEIIFDMDIFVVPSVTYRFSLTGIQYDTDWKMSSLDYGISIRFRF